MPNRELRWRYLLPGATTLAALLVIALYILTRVGVGALPGEKFTLYALSSQARGILKGSDVWVGGIHVGNVGGATFLPPTSGESDRLVLELRVLEQHRHLIRRDSYAQVRRGTRLIGNPVVQIGFGTSGAPVIEPGDTIGAVPQFDSEAIAASLDSMLRLLPLIGTDMEVISDEGKRIGRLLHATLSRKPASGSPLLALLESLGEIQSRFDSGSLALLLRDRAIPQHVASIRANAEAISLLYNIDESVAARYLRDSSLFGRINAVASQFGQLSRELDEKLARIFGGARAYELRREMEQLSASVRALREDASRHPLRYIVF